MIYIAGSWILSLTWVIKGVHNSKNLFTEPLSECFIFSSLRKYSTSSIQCVKVGGWGSFQLSKIKRLAIKVTKAMESDCVFDNLSWSGEAPKIAMNGQGLMVIPPPMHSERTSKTKDQKFLSLLQAQNMWQGINGIDCRWDWCLGSVLKVLGWSSVSGVEFYIASGCA